MASFATRRLIDAAAKLAPADRALLNLWVTRGLDDERLTALTGMSIDALQARREKLVAQLAAELGLPDTDVRGALEQISPDGEALSASSSNGAADVASGPSDVATVTDAAEMPPSTPVPPSAAEPPSPAPRGRRRRWLGLMALAVLVAIVIAIVAGRGSSPPTPHRAASAASPPTTATPNPAAANPAHPTGNPVPVPFAGLPGGVMHASGSVRLSGRVKHLKLNLTVRGLPVAHAGHYEVWLYNSVIDSQALGRLRAGHHRLTARLPANVRHYRWIDISFQPVGVVNHSGESELRASNPADTTVARLRKHASRTRHRLRQAAKVSAVHPARPAAHPGRHHSRPPDHRAGAHRRKRNAKGSSRARTSK